jgi:hypothetical protein
MFVSRRSQWVPDPVQANSQSFFSEPFVAALPSHEVIKASE